MRVMLSETLTRYYEVEMSDEIDVEELLRKANAIRPQCDSGHEALDVVLKTYKDLNNNEFEYAIGGSSDWDKPESPIGFEYEI